jgi:hypothetical protein
MAASIAIKYQAAIGCCYSVPPKHFLDFIGYFKDHLYRNSDKVNGSIKRLKGGVEN